MKRIKELVGIVFIGCCIGLVALVVLVSCAALIPIRWMIDAAAERRKSLCFRCAEQGMDRDSCLQLIYYRKPGIHTCTRCNMEYTVQRT